MQGVCAEKLHVKAAKIHSLVTLATSKHPSVMTCLNKTVFVASTAGVLEVEKRRPVDVLASILEERSAPKLEQFFAGYGAAEVAAMCFCLATCPPSTASPVHSSNFSNSL